MTQWTYPSLSDWINYFLPCSQGVPASTHPLRSQEAEHSCLLQETPNMRNADSSFINIQVTLNSWKEKPSAFLKLVIFQVTTYSMALPESITCWKQDVFWWSLCSHEPQSLQISLMSLKPQFNNCCSTAVCMTVQPSLMSAQDVQFCKSGSKKSTPDKLFHCFTCPLSTQQLSHLPGARSWVLQCFQEG